MRSTLLDSLISAQPCMQMFLSDKVFLKSSSLTEHWHDAKLGDIQHHQQQHWRRPHQAPQSLNKSLTNKAFTWETWFRGWQEGDIHALCAIRHTWTALYVCLRKAACQATVGYTSHMTCRVDKACCKATSAWRQQDLPEDDHHEFSKII